MRRPRNFITALIILALSCAGAWNPGAARSVDSAYVACASPKFMAARSYRVEDIPDAVAAADFNHDDKQDVAVANYYSGSVSILLNDGAGGFGAAENLAVGAGLRAIAVAYLNSDDHFDLVVANDLSSSVHVLLGDGTGGFSAATGFPAGASAFSLAVGDFNGDDKLDVVTANSNASDVSILLGDGAGGFGGATSLAAGESPVYIQLADVNNDMKLDAAVVGSHPAPDNVHILLGTGTGSFAAALNFSAGRIPSSLAIGDFNDDTKLDLAVANLFSHDVSILLGDGAGNFSPAINFGTGLFPRSVTALDFNGDGKTDLALGNFGSSNVNILLNACHATAPISGRITDARGQGVGGVTLRINGTQTKVATTDSQGNYSFGAVAVGGHYTLTPSKVNYTFIPASRSYPYLRENQPNQNFAARLNAYTINGQVKVGTTALGGVKITLTSTTPAGFATRTVLTNSAGNYSFGNLPAGRTYRLTPSKVNYSFTPASLTYTNLSSNRTANFAATLKSYGISGKVTKAGSTNGLGGVLMTLTSPTPAGFTPRKVTTTSTGLYTFTGLPAGRTYRLTPTRSGYIFNPSVRSYMNLSASQTPGPNTSFTGTVR